MTQVASEESIVGDLDDVELQSAAATYRLSRKDGKYWVSIVSRWGS